MEVVERKILLNPGPATTTQSVEQALVISDVCPRERSFCELYAGWGRPIDLADVEADPGKPGAEPTFRLAVLGAIDARDVRAFLEALRGYLRRVRG